jgi:hypothetical protein
MSLAKVMELNGTHQLFVYSDDVYCLGENTITVKKTHEIYWKFSKRIRVRNKADGMLYDIMGSYMNAGP